MKNISINTRAISNGVIVSGSASPVEYDDYDVSSYVNKEVYVSAAEDVPAAVAILYTALSA